MVGWYTDGLGSGYIGEFEEVDDHRSGKVLLVFGRTE
jgi:hypothetical protein